MMIKWQIVMILCLAASSGAFLLGIKVAFLISEAKAREIYGPPRLSRKLSDDDFVKLSKLYNEESRKRSGE